MKKELLIRHYLRMAGLLTFVGFFSLAGCPRSPQKTYEPPAAPTLTQPAPETLPGPSSLLWERKPFEVAIAGTAFAAEESGGPSRGITSGTSASPEKATDPVVVRNIREALQTDPGFSPQAKAIQVTAEKGIITLKGNVPTQREKTAVAVKIQQLAGNSYNVDNQLMVRVP